MAITVWEEETLRMLVHMQRETEMFNIWHTSPETLDGYVSIKLTMREGLT
jgi:hypothetical protein